MSAQSFLDRLAKTEVLKWTTEPARSPEASLRTDKIYGVTSQDDIDRVILARRAKTAAAKAKKPA